MDVHKEIGDGLKRADASGEGLESMHWLPRLLAKGSGLFGLIALYCLFTGKWGAMLLYAIIAFVLMYLSYSANISVTARRLRGMLSLRAGGEAELERDYVEMYMSTWDLPRADATALVRTMLSRVKTDLRASANQPSTLSGEEILANEKTSARLRDELAERRSDGVTDQDILWWHNMSLLEKGMILQDDLYNYLLFHHRKVDEGFSEDESEGLLPKHFVIYRDESNRLQGDDRPLPIELKDRINRYLISQGHSDAVGLRQRVEQASSMNAFIRQEMAVGKL